jgi:hypothetical protein
MASLRATSSSPRSATRSLLSSSQETGTKRGAGAGLTPAAISGFQPHAPVFSGNSDDETTLPKTDSDVDGATAIQAGAEEQACSVSALRRWLESAAIGDGRISTQSIAMDTSTLSSIYSAGHCPFRECNRPDTRTICLSCQHTVR